MLFWVTLKVALKSLAANKLRSVLAMLGIIIGVVAVIVVLALVAGARESVMGRISALGTNLLIVSPGQRGTGGVISGTQQNLVLEDAEALRDLPGVRQIAPVVRGSVQVKRFNTNTRTTLLGTTVTYFPIRAFEVERGAAFTEADADRSARVAVIGSNTAQNLFAADDPLGQQIKINGINFRVVGVLKSKGDQGYFNPDDQVLIPYTVAMKQVLGLERLNEIDIQGLDGADLTALQEQVSAVIRKRHRIQPGQPDDVNIRNQAEFIETASNVNRVLSLLGGGIASVSLLVGGIGIMNIMLVTVTERTREIGVRKAIGAKDWDILRQFLIESVLMSGLGGLLGVGIGVGIAKLVSSTGAMTATVQYWSIFLSIAFSAGVGVFFGFYPALRAARLDPIEALRYE